MVAAGLQHQPNGSRSMLIYKIAPRALWAEAESAGRFDGAPIDHADGYVHLSARDQVEETAARHFAGQSDLLLVAVEAEALPDLRWETSRGGALFPHHYGPLPMAAVRWVRPIEHGADGHRLPLDAE